MTPEILPTSRQLTAIAFLAAAVLCLALALMRFS